MRATVTAMMVAGNKEGKGSMVMVIVKRMAGKQHQLVMATRVVGKDEGNGEGGKSNGGNEEDDCEEEGNGE